MQLDVQYGRTRVNFTLRYARRKTLAIHVHPSGEVEVVAPEGTSVDAARARVARRAAWIVQQQRTFAQYPPPLSAREYVSGETLRYLGRQYRLRIEEGAEHIALRHGRLVVTLPDTRDAQLRAALVERWRRARADFVFREVYARALQLVEPIGIKHERGVEIRRLEKRWGSCSRSGRILLNGQLIAAPRVCIEYVIVHELCHLAEHHHGPAFYRLLTTVLPDWEARRDTLNRLVELPA
ncbi:metal-dependent hydrolase [Deinococcus seoulensis]|uniref:Metal-dependent hydrolase n=1 Tax=Deinococcus seoulensis TaxID=1837379 RepID=A0ABQ2RVP1_9DEIO|nr:SprT family zinc-dependent metalloprotease [Deinococcus seoulensis]GGR61589.1 metal-dependent hydrolase [Deinococcus seoulensis]